jgi:predicted PurR-regulated permease PerM
MAGIPGAGLLAMLVLLFGIAQIPAGLVSVPVVAYIWASDYETAQAIGYTIYLLLAGTADNVLKPLMLGRGVDAPMPVILLGALGGAISAGMIGMFVGAVMLAVGYQIFMVWVYTDLPEGAESRRAEEPGQA